MPDDFYTKNNILKFIYNFLTNILNWRPIN